MSAKQWWNDWGGMIVFTFAIVVVIALSIGMSVGHRQGRRGACEDLGFDNAAKVDGIWYCKLDRELAPMTDLAGGK